MYIDSLGVYGGMGIKTMKAFSRQKGNFEHLVVSFMPLRLVLLMAYVMMLGSHKDHLSHCGHHMGLKAPRGCCYHTIITYLFCDYSSLFLSEIYEYILPC